MKNKTPKPVHSVAILPDGSTLPLPGCKRYILEDDCIRLFNRDDKTIAILPKGSTLITNWGNPNHA